MASWPVRNLGVKLLSIGVAALLWLVVTGDPVVERSMRVGLELQRIPAGLELVGTVPDSVGARVRGPASRLSALAPGDLSAVVDVDGVKAGRRLFALTPAQVTAPFGVEVSQVTPATLPLEFEPTATAVVPVRARVEGTPVAGHSVTHLAVTPSQVRVTGPESAVQGVSELFTAPVSIAGATTLVREAVTIDTGESSLRLDGGPAAVVTVTISADTMERTVTGVAIALRGGVKGRLTPATAAVTVRGAREVVEPLTAADIVLFVDAQGDAPGRELVVQAEGSPRFVVSSISPSTVGYGAQSPRR